jgi:hypothetical protein
MRDGRHLRLCAAALAAGLLAVSLPLQDAHAALSVCSSDPIVTLSNGVVVDLSTLIQDARADVRGVAYTLHAPAGVRATSVINLDLGGSTFTLVGDDQSNTYDATIDVTTGSPGIAVTGSFKVISLPLNMLALQATSTQGVSGQNVLIHLTVRGLLTL